jgi:hypothetical protein
MAWQGETQYQTGRRRRADTGEGEASGMAFCMRHAVRTTEGRPYGHGLIDWIVNLLMNFFRKGNILL